MSKPLSHPVVAAVGTLVMWGSFYLHAPESTAPPSPPVVIQSAAR